MSNNAPPPDASASGFFDDDRVHFSKETGTWRLENEDGTELEYDSTKSQWVQVVSAKLLRCW